jgi:hypothetical protein
MTADSIAGNTVSKTAGAALDITSLANACQFNPGVAKTIYLWFQY